MVLRNPSLHRISRIHCFIRTVIPGKLGEVRIHVSAIETPKSIASQKGNTATAKTDLAP
jgi:hypothetical protein